MDDILKRIADNLAAVQADTRDINKTLADVQVTLTKQQLILDEHVRRTNNLEARVSPLELSEVRWALAAKVGVPLMGAIATALGLTKFLL